MLDTAGKDCIVCGKCCAHIPRVRDEHQNYYCRECYERVKSHRGLLADGPGDGDDSLVLEDTVDDFDAGTAVATAAGATIAEDGGSSTSAARLNPQVGHPRRDQDAEQLDWVGELTGDVRPTVNSISDLVRGVRSGALGPEVVGGVSLFLAGSGLIFYGYYALTSIATASTMILQEPLEALKILAYGVPPFVGVYFAIWLAGAGIQLAQRRAAGPVSTARWARCKRNMVCILAALCLLAIGGVAAWHSMQAPGASPGAEPFDHAELIAPTAAVVVAAAWLLLWPLYVLRWIKRSNVMLLARSWQ